MFVFYFSHIALVCTDHEYCGSISNVNDVAVRCRVSTTTRTVFCIDHVQKPVLAGFENLGR